MALEQLHGFIKQYIAEPGNFFNNLNLVQAFHREPVMTTNPRILLNNDGITLIPVFTSPEYYHHYLANLEKKGFEAIELPVAYVAEVVNEQELGGVILNPHTDDMVAFQREDLNIFLSYYGSILQDLISEDPEKEALYFIPGIMETKEEDQVTRSFYTIMNPEGERYIPVFSDLKALANWYFDEDFGGEFRRQGGMIFPWTMKQFLDPATGVNSVEGTKGYVVDPFKEDRPEGQVHLWEDSKA